MPIILDDLLFLSQLLNGPAQLIVSVLLLRFLTSGESLRRQLPLVGILQHYLLTDVLELNPRVIVVVTLIYLIQVLLHLELGLAVRAMIKRVRSHVAGTLFLRRLKHTSIR